MSNFIPWAVFLWSIPLHSILNYWPIWNPGVISAPNQTINRYAKEILKPPTPKRMAKYKLASALATSFRDESNEKGKNSCRDPGVAVW